LVHLNKTKSSKMFLIYSFSRRKISSDMEKYLMTCHQILCRSPKYFLESTKVYWLWTWAWRPKLLNVASCEGLKLKINTNMHFKIHGATNI
jgi:hypothetical protein